MWIAPNTAAIFDAMIADAQHNADQLAFWQSCTDPTKIEGHPLAKWNTEQLQAGLTYYSGLRDQAVPNSNEWLALTDRIHSIQENLDSNRIPWAYTLWQGVDYWSPISSRS